MSITTLTKKIQELSGVINSNPGNTIVTPDQVVDFLSPTLNNMSESQAVEYISELCVNTKFNGNDALTSRLILGTSKENFDLPIAS